MATNAVSTKGNFSVGTRGTLMLKITECRWNSTRPFFYSTCSKKYRDYGNGRIRDPRKSTRWILCL